MKRKWDVSQVQICSTAVSAEEYNLRLESWADTVYRHFCQLSLDSAEVPVTQSSVTSSSLTESAGT